MLIDFKRLYTDFCGIGNVAAEHNTIMAAVSLAWLLKKPAVTTVIIGVKKKEQLLENLKATNVKLSENDIEKLNEASVLSPEYPGRMMRNGFPREYLLHTGELIKQD